MQKTTQFIKLAKFISASLKHEIYNEFMHSPVLENEIFKILTYPNINLSCPTIICSLLLVQRYVTQMKFHRIEIPVRSSFKIWLTALALADTVSNDNPLTTKSWAMVARLRTSDCIRMRRIFLDVIQYHINITDLQYTAWVTELEAMATERIKAKQSQKALTSSLLTRGKRMPSGQVFLTIPEDIAV